jgi:hypothetical protein
MRNNLLALFIRPMFTKNVLGSRGNHHDSKLPGLILGLQILEIVYVLSDFFFTAF